MRSHFESFIGQLDRCYFFLRIDQHIEYPGAALANEMLVALDQRIEMLRAADHQDLQLVVGD